MADLVNISVGNAAVVALLGYCVVFFGIVLLMIVVMIMAKIYINKAKKAEAAVVAAPAEVPEVKAEPAPGSAGELKLYDTDPRDAAMIMAIVANKLGKPINELRFKSIREIKDDEV